MPKNQDKRAWSIQEIEYLKVGFQMGTRLKIMAKVLKRSETSINKALSRFGIRPYGAKGRIKNNKRIIPCLSVETYQQTIDKHCQKLEPSRFFQLEKKQDPVLKSDNLIKEKDKSLLESSLDAPCLNQKTNIINFPHNWIDFEAAVNLLQDIDDRVNYSDKGFRKKTIFINGKPFTAQQMLLRLNRLRVQSGLDPVYITNITEF